MFTSKASIDLGQMERAEALNTLLLGADSDYIVDLGCGEGHIARALATHGARVAGYDPLLDQEIGWTQEGAGRYRLAKASAEATPEPDGCADAVLFVFSLHHVPRAKLGPALREAHRLLKPTGRLCVVEPVAEGPSQYVMAPYHDETAVRSDALAALAAHAAPMFDVEDVILFAERTMYSDFEAYAARAALGTRFNDYTIEQVTAPEVRRRFAEMSAANQGAFDQPVRINLFSGRRDAQLQAPALKMRDSGR